ncbi:MAG: hypothetical protein LC720_02300 [Actinobacteria bacterium]|nr:hypothetical protein [Actinomycetota bacterium]
MDQREEKVIFETSSHTIRGTVTLAREGYRSRVSDMLNASERTFIPLTDATIEPLSGGEVTHHSFVAVARSHIVFAVGLKP